jgi:hypothetical protein
VRTLIEDGDTGVLVCKDVTLEASGGSAAPQGRSIQALV